MQPGQKSNAGLVAGVIGGVAVASSIIAAVASSSKKPTPRLGGVRRPVGAVKKPCGCGR